MQDICLLDVCFPDECRALSKFLTTMYRIYSEKLLHKANLSPEIFQCGDLQKSFVDLVITGALIS